MPDSEYRPDVTNPVNLDMRPYVNESIPGAKGLLASAVFYGIIALACIVALCFRTRVVFIYQYTLLLEAMVAILLFLAIKCGLKWLRESKQLFAVITIPARIISATNSAEGTEITVEYTLDDSEAKCSFTEKFNINFLDELQKTELNALPLCIRKGLGGKEIKWLDLHFENGILSTLSLKRIDKSKN